MPSSQFLACLVIVRSSPWSFLGKISQKWFDPASFLGLREWVACPKSSRWLHAQGKTKIHGLTSTSPWGFHHCTKLSLRRRSRCSQMQFWIKEALIDYLYYTIICSLPLPLKEGTWTFCCCCCYLVNNSLKVFSANAQVKPFLGGFLLFIFLPVLALEFASLLLHGLRP